MSNGFKYYTIEKHYLETSVNHWLAEQLQETFGSFPITLSHSNLEELRAILTQMHEFNRPEFEEFINFVAASSNSVCIDRYF